MRKAHATPRPSREGEPGRPQATTQAGIFLNRSAHRHPHSAHQPTAPHPPASTCRDRSLLDRAAASRPPNKTAAARSAYKDRQVRRSPALPARKCPASANPRSWHRRIHSGTAADQDLHCAESTFPRVRQPAVRRSKMSAHARGAADRWATAPAVRDKTANRLAKENLSRFLGGG